MFEKKNSLEKLNKKFSLPAWIKKHLKKHLFDKVKSTEILNNFLPKAVLSVMKTDTTFICKVKYKTFSWIGDGSKLKEAKENVVIKVLKDVFGIELEPVHLSNFKDLKKDLEDLVVIKESGKGFVSSLVVSIWKGF